MKDPTKEIIEEYAETFTALKKYDETPDTEWDDNIQHAYDSILFNHNPIEADKQFGKMLESVLNNILTSRDTYWKERVREIIKCKRCNGQGWYLGASLGYSECGDCGGDGHCLYNREEEKLDTLLDNLK